ncbi:hypothetical protein RB195_022908 [Necator americanus]|uniref:DUF7083 domain-containing protein n=1 Tax=Necator americanus TaxID=51031 RepID=A0ABR1EHN4_NECAM
MVEQMRIQHEEMKTLPTALAPTQRTTVQDVSKNQYDQLSKDVQMFVSDEEVGHTFAYWYKRYGGVIRDSVLLDSKKRDLILMKLDEDAHRKYADDILPKQPPEIDFETTIANLEKLFAPRKTLIRRRYECLRINCPPLTASFVPFRDYANMIKRMKDTMCVNARTSFSGGRQLRTSLTLLKESAKDEGTRNVEIEEQFNLHHRAQKRSYHQEELVWLRDYRPRHEKWIPARVKNRYGQTVYDMLTEEDVLWRRQTRCVEKGTGELAARRLKPRCRSTRKTDSTMVWQGRSPTSTTMSTIEHQLSCRRQRLDQFDNADRR